jgi:phenylalanyl-tRNA synthetase beta chain
MPNIKINVEEFRRLLGKDITAEELDEKASFLGAHWNHVEGDKWDVETYPNRPDLLSVEGLARAYRGFFDLETGLPEYRVEEREVGVKVDESVEDVRPYIGAAVVRGIEFDERTINGMVQLQEKLHETMGRRRDKIAIGLHDMGEIEPPFTYKAVEPDAVSFTPLKREEQMQLGEIVEEHEKGQEYGWILEDEEKYPVIEDSEGQVLSFPPIINNQLTEVDTETTDIFIDVTGKHEETVKKALNIIATALAERNGAVEKVMVSGELMPDLEPEERELDIEYFNSISGLDLEPDEIVRRLERMNYGAEEQGDSIKVQVPAYRTDIMHSYDLIEDAVIAHGYRNVEPQMPNLDTLGGEKSIEELKDSLRDVLVGTGALEAHTYILSNKEKLFERMEKGEEEIAEMSNPLTEDYSVARNWLLPSLLNSLKRNRQHSYPQKLFEIGEVVELDDSDKGASNSFRAAYVSAGETDYNDVRGVLQAIERDLGIELEVRGARHDSLKFDRSAKVMMEGEKVGIIGEIKDEVLENWELSTDAACVELDVSKLHELK